MNSTLTNFSTVTAELLKRAGSFGEWLKVGLHSVVAFEESSQCRVAKNNQCLLQIE